MPRSIQNAAEAGENPRALYVEIDRRQCLDPAELNLQFGRRILHPATIVTARLKALGLALTGIGSDSA